MARRSGANGNGATVAPPQITSPTSLLDNSAEIEHVTPGNLRVPAMAAFDSVFRASYWYAGFNPDELTTQKRFDVYDEMLTGAACRSPLNVLLYSVLRKGWTVEPAIDDPDDPRSEEAKTYADALRWCLENIEDEAGNVTDFTQVLYNIGLGAWYGFSVQEMVYRLIEGGEYDGKLGWAEFADKPPKMIGFDLDKDTLAVRNLIPYTPVTGYGPPVPVEKCIRYTHAGTRNLPHGNGIGRSCYKHWFLLDGALKCWALAAQRLGVVVVGKYPAGNAQAMEDARAALNKFQQSSVGAIPNNVDLQIETPNGDVLASFKVKADWHTQQIAAAILGSTLTTGEGERSGSLALGKVHDSTKDDIAGYLRGRIETRVTLDVARRWVKWNYGPDALDLCPKISLGQYDDEDRKAKADMYGTLIDKGVTHAQAKYIREDLGLPPMDPQEKALIDQEKQEEQERQQREADARLSMRGGK